MTLHLLARARFGLVAGLLLSIGPQRLTTETLKAVSAKSNVPRESDDGRPARDLPILPEDQPFIQRGVAAPSSEFRTYVEGELVRVGIPSNWLEHPGSNNVTFAPEGAYGSVGVRSVFTHGIGMGLARNDKHNLRVTTNDFIQSYVLGAPSSGRRFRYGRVTIGDRRGLHTILSTVSEATGEPAQIEVFTALLRDDTLFYLLAVAPRDCVSDYALTFRRVVGSIQIMDSDRGAL